MSSGCRAWCPPAILSARTGMIVLRAKRQRCARMTQRSLFRLTLLFDPVAGPVRVHSRRVRPAPLPPRATQTITFPPETDKACSQTKGQNLPFCPPFGTVRNGAVSGQRTGWGTRLVNPSAMLCGWESTSPNLSRPLPRLTRSPAPASTPVRRRNPFGARAPHSKIGSASARHTFFHFLSWPVEYNNGKVP